MTNAPVVPFVTNNAPATQLKWRTKILCTMSDQKSNITTIDGNEAAAYIAYRVNEVCAIYPITPSSAMAEWADEWSAKKATNIWGNIPDVVEMQSEGGAAGTVHGALQTALTTTFTASQGLMLMLPPICTKWRLANGIPYRRALLIRSGFVHFRRPPGRDGSPFHRFCDVVFRQCAGSARLRADRTSSLESRLPFLHFFDDSAPPHEVNKIELISDAHIRHD